MWQNIIVIVIIVVCAIYIGRRFYRQLSRKTPSCGCECPGCDSPDGKPVSKLDNACPDNNGQCGK